MPKFLISFAGCVFYDTKLLLDKQYYGPMDYRFDIPSIHIFGKKEPFPQYV